MITQILRTLSSDRRRAACLAALLTILFLLAAVPRAVPDVFARSSVRQVGTHGVTLGGRSLVASDSDFDLLNSSVFTDDPFTIEIITKPHAMKPERISTIVSYSTGSSFNWSVEQHGDSLMILHRNRGMKFRDAITPLRSQQFVIIINRDSCTLAKDGAHVRTATWTRSEAHWNPKARLSVGNVDSGGYPWNGEIERLRIYDRPLKPMEVEQIYSGQSHGENLMPPLLQLIVENDDAMELGVRYADPIPLTVYKWPWSLKFRDLFDPSRQIISANDILLNIAITLFLGLFITISIDKCTGYRTVIRSTAIVFALSLFVESLQLFSPVRVASIIDVAMNTLGALAGSLVWTFWSRRNPGRNIRLTG